MQTEERTPGRPDHEIAFTRRASLRPSWRQRLTRRDTGPQAAVVNGVYYRHRTRFYVPWWERFLAGIVATLVVLVVGGGAFVITQRHKTTEVSLTDAIERFEAERPAAPATQADGSQAASIDRTHTAPKDATADAPVVADDTPATKTDAPVAAKAPTASTADAPREGVYVYNTRGGEKVSTFGASHTYPSETYAMVRHLGGCKWEHRNEPIAEHVDITTACVKSDRIELLGQARYVEFFGQRDGTDAKCEPPIVLYLKGEAPGAVRTGSCNDGKGDAAKMKRTFIGMEQMTIGGEKVNAAHIRIDGTFNGRATGRSSDDLWFSPTTALVYKWDRMVDTKAKAWGVEAHYTEDATFTLASLDPRS